MTVTVRKIITEHTNGRRENPASPTGWERRVGSRPVPTPIVGQVAHQDIWEPCEGPRTMDYGDPEARGGLIRTIVEVNEPITLTLSPEIRAGLIKANLSALSHVGSHRANGESRALSATDLERRDRMVETLLLLECPWDAISAEI